MEPEQRDKRMTDGLVILGTVAIVGLVAVLTVALVYNRSLWVKGSSKQLEVETRANNGEADSDFSRYKPNASSYEVLNRRRAAESADK